MKKLILINILSLCAYAEEEAVLVDVPSSLRSSPVVERHEIETHTDYSRGRQSPTEGQVCATVGGHTHCRSASSRPFTPPVSRVDYFCGERLKTDDEETFWACFDTHAGRDW